MAGLDFSISVEQRYGFSLTELDDAERRRLEDLLRDARDELREHILQTWPRDTGRSVRSWLVDVQLPRFVVSNAVDYTEWVQPGGMAEGASGREVLAARDAALGRIEPRVRELITEARQPEPRVERLITPSPRRALSFERGLRRAYSRLPARLREAGARR